MAEERECSARDVCTAVVQKSSGLFVQEQIEEADAGDTSFENEDRLAIATVHVGRSIRR
jgi:hypothetical protein